MLEFRPAKRHAVPLLIEISSVSGGGKTMSAILLAAGLAGPSGVVGLIDTENGRGEMYADDPLVTSALPKGYRYVRMDSPYAPTNYIEYLKAAEQAGITVCIVDSTSHEFEGLGGLTDIAEKNKRGGMPNWAKAKLEHKRFLQYVLSSSMHIIFCMRARDKTKIVKVGGKEEFVAMGLQPICEKNWSYDMTVRLQCDETTHFTSCIKGPAALTSILKTPRLLTPADGEKMRLWNEGGAAVDPNELLLKRGRAAAEQGMEKYKEFVESLQKPQAAFIKRSPAHEENKRLATDADAERSLVEADEIARDPAQDPGPASEPAIATGGKSVVDQILELKETLGIDKFERTLRAFEVDSVEKIASPKQGQDILKALLQLTDW